jgi:hypothetical protein
VEAGGDREAARLRPRAAAENTPEKHGTDCRCPATTTGSIVAAKEAGAANTDMAVVHALAMDLIGRAKKVDQIHQFESANNAANKLMRTFAVQLETPARLWRGGEQKMTVEHVHVHSGAQAVVGNVTQLAARRGDGDEKCGQPHGPTDARAVVIGESPPMLGADTARNGVPGKGDEQGQVPIARWRKG